MSKNLYPSVTIQKYELKACSIINEIRNLKENIRVGKGIKRYSSANSCKIQNIVQRLTKAEIEIIEVITLLLEAAKKK